MEDKDYNKVNFMNDVSEIYAKFPMNILSEQTNQMAGEWQNLSMKYVYKMQSKIDTLEQELSKVKADKEVWEQLWFNKCERLKLELSKANDKLKKIEEYLQEELIRKRVYKDVSVIEHLEPIQEIIKGE